MNDEQNIRDGLMAKAPKPMPDMDKFKGCNSIATNAIGVFLVVTGLVFLVIASL